MVQPATAPSRDSSFGRLFSALLGNVERVIQGKREQVHLALVCLLAEGHLLIEDVPGVGKTSLAKAIAASIGGTCHRIQFTPDLLPSDVTGVSVWNRTADEFEFRPGGVFANVVLADEINRASPKTQSALLEAMEERQVTVDAAHLPAAAPVHGDRHPEPDRARGHLSPARGPARPLPHAPAHGLPRPRRRGRDPRRAGRARRVGRLALAGRRPPVDVAEAAALVSPVHVAPEVRDYVLDVVAASRRHPDLLLGASPRGSLSLQRAARALAASFGRSYVLPDDVKRVRPAGARAPAARSRPTRSCRGVSADDVVRAILASVPVPGATAG